MSGQEYFSHNFTLDYLIINKKKYNNIPGKISCIKPSSKQLRTFKHMIKYKSDRVVKKKPEQIEMVDLLADSYNKRALLFVC